MGEDTEMIAAHTVEEIARRHHFAPKAINQIKTALVEACINAAEHSQVPTAKFIRNLRSKTTKSLLRFPIADCVSQIKTRRKSRPTKAGAAGD